LIDKYAPNAPFIPTDIPSNGVSRRVPGSKYMPLDVCWELLGITVISFENALNRFLEANSITLKQHQFDAMISFSYQYGEHWWILDKEMPKFLKRGDFSPEETMRVFLLHVPRGEADPNYNRRMAEANLFLYGY
jgi:GH24 family phage-related lysozyme (muramidase)